MEIGLKLKEAREAKGLSLDDLQKKTKIQPRYLKAIEKGDFSVMPGNFYIRAFIKEYAVAVDLNPDEVLTEFKHELPSAEEDTVEYTRIQRSRKNTPSTKTPAVFSLLPTVIAVLLIIGVAFVIWLFTSDYFSEDSSPTTENETSEQNGGDEVQLPAETEEEEPVEEETDENAEEDENASEAEDEETVDETTLELTEYANNESTYTLTNAGDSLELVFETDTANWLEVENDSGENFYESTFQATESPLELDLSGTEQIYLRFGEPTELSIMVNGVALELSEDIGPAQIQRVWINVEQDTE
ncbi:helix-turn-helix domain-containing protein [Paraliobacillus zengyii]|uniref:helix-turn-helix domain-containing protein n=1 Tax=Paraliobacillus zengyii TaxID=2213194 RepID=UPI000E3CE176|nr:RodZ domain-containing protein [Paraliobacillus zengyii]